MGIFQVFINVVFITLVLSTEINAQTHSGPPNLQFAIAISEDIPMSQRTTIDVALNLVKTTLSEEMPLIHNPQQNDFIVHFGSTKEFNERYPLNHTTVKMFSDFEGDAYSMLLSLPNGQNIVIVRILWDKVMYENNQERKHALAHLTVALGHEIYGNVRNFVNPKNRKRPMVPTQGKENPEYLRAEIFAFNAGIEFIDKLTTKLHLLGPDFLTPFQNIRAKEVQIRDHYQARLDAIAPTVVAFPAQKALSCFQFLK